MAHIKGAGPRTGSLDLARSALRDWTRFSAVLLWIVFMVVFGVLKPGLFLTSSTIQSVFSQGAVTATLALAALVPLTTDTFDLAIGEVLALTVVVMNWGQMNWHLPVGVLAVIVVVIGGAIGWISGFVVVKLRVNSFIATLGMSQILVAAQLYISQNKQLAASFPAAFTDIGTNTIAGIPYLDLILLVIAVIAWFVLEQTPLGRHMFAVGGNREAARLAGIRSGRIVWGSLVASGAIAAVAGVMYTAQVGAYSGDVGSGFLFPALAAVFFGASQLSRRPNVWGTLIAYFALAFGIQGLALAYGVGSFWVSPLFEGVALVAAVALASMQGAIGNGRDGRAVRRLLRGRRHDDDDSEPATVPPRTGEPSRAGQSAPNHAGAIIADDVTMDR